MNDGKNIDGRMNANNEYEKNAEYAGLAQWLQEILQSPEQKEPSPSELLPGEHRNAQLELVIEKDYHLPFYQQIPDFVMALLTNDPLATDRYASLLFHMAGCRTCHATYLDLYSSMRAAISPQTMRPSLGQGTRTLAAIPHPILGRLCRSLISQAEALLRQAHRDHEDQTDAARSLLQLAIRISAPISQSSIRSQALRDLVRVATLVEGESVAQENDPNVTTYTPVLAGSGGIRRSKTTRRVVNNPQSAGQEQTVIQLHSQSLEGSIVQNGQMLELHLHDLATSLRGHFVTISVLLGSLIEPVRWLGGNPRAIRSSSPVNEQGTLIMPVGSTDLELSNPEERNLLEVLFMLLEVRLANEAR
jgi:hypothetical protein